MPFDGAFSPMHWLIIGVVALLVLGPNQLPDLARRAGQFVREVRQVRHHLSSGLRDLVSEFDLADPPAAIEQPAAVRDGDASSSNVPPDPATNHG